MDPVTATLTAVVVGSALLVGVGVGRAISRSRDSRAAGLEESLRRELAELALEQRAQAEQGRDAAVQAAIEQLATVHRTISEQERTLGSRELAGQRELIESRLDTVQGELTRMGELVRDLERDRESKFGQLSNELRRQQEGVSALAETTAHLREALASQKARGQWGERMADDVLRLAGFVEGVNYQRQHTLDGSAGRPDYTFLLPGDLVLHMDVKFPLDNYVRYLECASELEQRKLRDAFLRDVRARVRELTTRGYTDGPAAVDCLLLFIPNEQVYGFVQQHGQAVLDEALRNGIVVCSPLTLYAVLAVVRQAVDHFRLERTTNDILGLLGEFTQQWDKFVTALEAQQQRFDKAAREFETLTGTRRRALEKPLERIGELRQSCEPEPDGATEPSNVTPLALEG